MTSDRSEGAGEGADVGAGEGANEGAGEGAPMAAPTPDTIGVGSRLRQARVRARLLGEPLRPVKIDRFTILGPLGAGGMGEVYAAYDDKLERKVAIKLVRAGAGADPAANARLLDEAKALARLSHPNVVALYEVGELDGRVFLAMELIAGKPLTEWLAEAAKLSARRRRREALRLFLAAGRGLVAAHRQGLVHRDIKPGNVVVGDDGRVRVVDFGLAAAARADTAPAGVAGTPRYMAPEQLASGQPGDAKSDQWSFCLSLAEALCGPQAISAALGEAGAPTSDAVVRVLHAAVASAAMPAPVRRALLRGLDAAPAQRHPDVDALCSALEAWPRRRARAATALAIGLAVVGLTVAFSRRAAGPVAVACDGGAIELATTWNPQLRGALLAAPPAPSHGSPAARAYHDQGLTRVADALDRYARAWGDERDRACRAYHRGGESAALYDRRLACLARRRADLAGAVEVLRGGAITTDRAIELAAALPSLAECADPAQLLAAAPLPTDDGVRRRVAALEEKLSRARALEVAGKVAEATAQLDRLAAAAETEGYAPLVAAARLAQARVAITSTYDGCAACKEPLLRALTLGLEAGLDALAVEAIARLIFVERSRPEALDATLTYVPIAEALGRRLPNRQFVTALLANNLGVLWLGRGEPERARAYFERSAAQAEELTDLELLRARVNLAIVTPEGKLRQARLDEALSIITTRLGPRHSLTLRQQIIAALYTPSPARAYARLVAACDDLAALHEKAADWPMYCLYHRAMLELELSRADLAAARFLDFSRLPAEGSPLADIAAGYAALLSAAPTAAERAFARAAQKAGDPDPRPEAWWSAAAPALAALGRGEALLASGRPATAELERALDLLDGLCARSFAVEYAAQRARAQRLLARAYRARGRPPSAPPERSAGALTAAALAWYRDAGEGYEAQVRALTER